VIQQPINTDGSSVFSGSKGVIPVKFKLYLNGVPTCQMPPATISLVRTDIDALPIDPKHLQDIFGERLNVRRLRLPVYV